VKKGERERERVCVSKFVSIVEKGEPMNVKH